MNLELNSELISYLKDQNFSTEDRAMLLVSTILFETAVQNKEIFKGPKALAELSEDTLQKMVAAGILEESDVTGYSLKMPTFAAQVEDSKDKFSWVGEFRNLFKQVNPDRWGTLSTCKERMKKFFSENPEVRKEDVMEATVMYLNNTDFRYIMKSHKFIFDGTGTARNSTLEEWLEKLEHVRNTQVSQNNQDITDKIQ